MSFFENIIYGPKIQEPLSTTVHFNILIPTYSYKSQVLLLSKYSSININTPINYAPCQGVTFAPPTIGSPMIMLHKLLVWEQLNIGRDLALETRCVTYVSVSDVPPCGNDKMEFNREKNALESNKGVLMDESKDP